MPKSAILMLFFSSSNRFSGFRSRWLQDNDRKHEQKHACAQYSFPGQTPADATALYIPLQRLTALHLPPLICLCLNKGFPPHCLAVWGVTTPRCLFLLVFPSPFALHPLPLISQTATSEPAELKGHGGESGKEVVFISCHSLPLNTARGISIQQTPSLALKGAAERVIVILSCTLLLCWG